MDESNKSNVAYCLICNYKTTHNGLVGHVTAKHHIKMKEYYDTYIRKENEGICPVCNKETRFINSFKGYKQFCSLDCATPHIQEKLKQTCLERYGVENFGASTQAMKKKRQTMQSKYGVDYFCTTKKCLEAGHSKEALEKLKNTLLTRYSVTNAWSTPNCQAASHSDNANKKRYITRKLKGWKRSSFEDLTKKTFENLDIDYKHNYKTTVYPYLCDFYLPDKDLYIELNFFWMHGSHFYRNNKEDITIANNWKSKKTEYYDTAVKVWTESDLAKKDCAIKNKLNYVVIWNINQLHQFFDDIQTKDFIGYCDYNEYDYLSNL